jgi:4-azaleucine resistance transporter AzlC
MDREALSEGFKAGIPIAAAVLLVAISYGVLAEPIFGAGATLAMSVFVFAGSAQFGSAAVIAAGGGISPAVIAACLLNARYIPMGIALAPSLNGGWLSRAAYGNTMIDASWAMANRGGGRFDPDFMVGATIASYPAWLGGTAAGVFAGDLIGDPADLGLDVLFPAFFLVLLLGGELQEGRRPIQAALLGAVIGLALTPITPPGVPVIAASAAALLGLIGSRPDPGESELEGDPVG